ncbi:hypothetical protein IKQ21_06480 [bacterium]|nr:hypothetical protein [bacterium]
MYLPYYLCDVIRHTLFEEKCKPVFYHINDNFMPEIDFPENSYIIYPNYFGICGENVKKLVGHYKKLIVDNAHAFFDTPSGFACFNSGAKFNMGDIAFLWIKNRNSFSVKSDDNPSNTYHTYIKKCRNRFWELHKTYSGINCLNIKYSKEMTPFCYPLLVKDIDEADKIVKELQDKGLTVYRYWNLLPESYNEYKFYSRLVPIPIAEILDNKNYPLNAQ